jgi:hypothetical protein
MFNPPPPPPPPPPQENYLSQGSTCVLAEEPAQTSVNQLSALSPPPLETRCGLPSLQQNSLQGSTSQNGFGEKKY